MAVWTVSIADRFKLERAEKNVESVPAAIMGTARIMKNFQGKTTTKRFLERGRNVTAVKTPTSKVAPAEIRIPVVTRMKPSKADMASSCPGTAPAMEIRARSRFRSLAEMAKLATAPITAMSNADHRLDISSIGVADPMSFSWGKPLMAAVLV